MVVIFVDRVPMFIDLIDTEGYLIVDFDSCKTDEEDLWHLTD